MGPIKNLTFPNPKSGKGQYAFYCIKLSLFAEKNEIRQKYHNFIRGVPDELGRRPLTNEKLGKLIIFGGGSGHPNFMNPFEYDK